MHAKSSQHNPYVLQVKELEQILGAKQLKRCTQQNAFASGNGAVSPERVRALFESLDFSYPHKRVAFINLKGGVGKTTSAISLATRAAQYGFKTCLLDLDSQASATLAFDVEPAADDPIFYDVWQNPAEMLPGSLLQVQDNLFLLASALENALLETSLVNPTAQKNAMATVCNTLEQHGFDCCIIDCPPSLGTAVISSICASRTIVVPLGSDAFSFRGLDLTIKEIDAICSTFGLERPAIQPLLTRMDKRYKQTEIAWQRLQEQYASLATPLAVRTSSELAKALENRQTVFASTHKSNAREDYDAFARSVLGLDTFLKKP